MMTRLYLFLFEDLIHSIKSQAVNHPYLVVHSKSFMERSVKKVEANDDDQECGLCHDLAEDPVVSSLLFFLSIFT